MAFSGGYAPPKSARAGYAGVIGIFLIFLAIFAIVWGGLDPTANFRTWTVLSFELFGGLIFSALLGFTLARRPSMKNEYSAVLLGVLAGSLFIMLEMVILTLGVSMSTSQGLWLSLLAPAAETMLFIVAPYQMLTILFPRMPLVWKAIFSDAFFSFFHYFAYGFYADFWLKLIVLVLGNTVFILTYHMTRNATAPMIAHLMMNLAPNSQAVGSLLLQWGPAFLLMIGVFFILLTVFGGHHR